MSNTNTPHNSIAGRLEEALLLSGMSQTKFCYLHFGDPAFITKLRKGRQVRATTREKIEALLKEMGL